MGIGHAQRPLVGIAVDAAMGHGRGIMRGVMRYVNARRQWRLHEDLRVGASLDRWPGCDGAIVSDVDARMVQRIARRTGHMVWCSSAADPSVFPAASLNDHEVGRTAAAHLIECRLSHFGYYGRPGDRLSDGREQGYSRALESAGFGCAVCPTAWPAAYGWISRDHWPGLIQWLKALPKPVGIFAMDDAAAHDLTAACQEADLSVPDYVAVLGVNDDDLLCDSAWPPISSVVGDFIQVGYLAAQMLDRLLSGQTLGPEEREIRLPPLGVRRRMSTDTLAVDDPNLAEAVRFIREHACDPCTVQDVLRHVPVGRRWLERQFVRQIGRSPHEEITRVRMQVARRLLLESDETLPKIAGRCGFSAPQNFSRAFRQTLGQTPATFRRTHRYTLP